MFAKGLHLCHYRSLFGCITLVSDGESLTGLWFDSQSHFPTTLPDIFSESVCTTSHLPVFEDTIRWLDNYFAGRDPGFTPALNPSGTDFQHRVWELVRRIPYGQTMSYGEIARLLTEERNADDALSGKKQSPVSARAVGQALASNPILLITPCHRVIGSDGRMHGFAGGLARQAQLLTLERP